MPITPGWYDAEKHIFLFHFTYPVRDWQSYRSAIDDGMEMMNQVDHDVIMIFDPEDIAMPAGNPLPHLRYAVQSRPDHVIAAVAIVNNHFAATMMNWLKRIGFYHWIYVVETREQAQEVIIELMSEREKQL
ncbi:hypothetical protein G4Y79_00040 [Phototrophicus methaneseepsis]|uniref:Uncharacterized protein n=1 Tax=Phototrophicus methaneseepsis TaxID=2710758 RepID=A0A7S8IDN3_9CHLR|nr:hypothetical protein [Phototrophicus methaneseepsis]QPC82800.1 hypothetical protein G4Y79_00040 [Phototrophicus methaneseepsis]